MRIKHEQLKRLRVQAGWTQEEVAAKCRIDVRTYRKYERGEVNRGLTGLDDFNRSDQYDVLDRIAAALGLQGPDDLIEKRGAAGGDSAPGPGSPYHPSWYVHREPEEKKALNRLRSAGAPVVLQGPWLYGKATLLGHLLERAGTPEVAGEPPARVVSWNLYDLEEGQLQSLDTLLKALAQRLLTDLAAAPQPPQGLPAADDDEAIAQLVAEAWQSPASEKQKLGGLLRKHGLLGRHRLLLSVERAERLQGTGYMHDFFAMLRGWAESGSKEGWSRLRILVTVSTEPTLLESTDHSSFFALANPIRLDDMERGQVMQLADLHRLRLSDGDVDQLMALLGGHPYLLRTALYEATISETSVGQLLSSVDWNGGVFAQHLLHLRSWLTHGGLLSALCGVIAGDGFALPFEDFCRLYSKGLVVERARGVYRARCRLYEEYFGAVCRSVSPGGNSGPGDRGEGR